MCHFPCHFPQLTEATWHRRSWLGNAAHAWRTMACLGGFFWGTHQYGSPIQSRPSNGDTVDVSWCFMMFLLFFMYCFMYFYVHDSMILQSSTIFLLWTPTLQCQDLRGCCQPCLPCFDDLRCGPWPCFGMTTARTVIIGEIQRPPVKTLCLLLFDPWIWCEKEIEKTKLQ